jgi:hypothetical protein
MWRISEGDDTDAIRLEVQDRLRRLNGVDTVDENGFAQSEPELDEHLTSPEKVEKAKERWKHGRVRVNVDGRTVWKRECDCHKEILPGFEKKWKWVWNGPQDEHERS